MEEGGRRRGSEKEIGKWKQGVTGGVSGFEDGGHEPQYVGGR